MTPSPRCLSDFEISVEVKNPIVHTTWDEGQYTSYAIFLETNNVAFTYPKTLVRRRFSEFTRLRKMLKNQHPNVVPPDLPPKTYFSDNLCQFVIQNREKGLEAFLYKVLNTRIYLSNRGLHLFVQSNMPMPQIESLVYGETVKNLKSEPHHMMHPCPIMENMSEEMPEGCNRAKNIYIHEFFERPDESDSSSSLESHSYVTLGSRITVCSPSLHVPINLQKHIVLSSIHENMVPNSLDSECSSTPGYSSPTLGKSPTTHGILHSRCPSLSNSTDGSPVHKKKVSFNSEVTVAHLLT